MSFVVISEKRSENIQINRSCVFLDTQWFGYQDLPLLVEEGDVLGLGSLSLSSFEDCDVGKAISSINEKKNLIKT